MLRVTIEHVEKRNTLVGEGSCQRSRAFGKGRKLALLLSEAAEQRDVCDRRNKRDRKAGRRHQIRGPRRCAIHCEYLPREASRPFAGRRRTTGVMEPLEQLRSKIAGFPGYDDEVERRRSDAYVRSYLGEALADLLARNVLEPAQREQVDGLLLRVGFADPHNFAAHPVPGAPDSTKEGAVAAADAATVTLADRASSIDAASAAPYLDDVSAALDQRDAAIRAAELKMP